MHLVASFLLDDTERLSRTEDIQKQQLQLKFFDVKYAQILCFSGICRQVHTVFVRCR